MQSGIEQSASAVGTTAPALGSLEVAWSRPERVFGKWRRLECIRSTRLTHGVLRVPTPSKPSPERRLC